jgi:hypothetical protein
MNKKFILLALAFGFLIFGLGLVSAHNNGWDNLNRYAEDRVVHNDVYDYFKYGSYRQHNGNYPVYRELSYSKYYAFPYGNRLSVYNHHHNNDRYGKNIKVYNNYPDRAYGREHATGRTYVLNCGYGDGFYRDCY